MIAQFALRLICGMSLMWALMPRRQVTSGFFRIQMLVVMGLGVLAALTIQVQDPLSNVLWMRLAVCLSLAIVAAGFLGSVLWTLERRLGGERIGFLLLSISAGLILLVNSTDASHQITEWRWSVWMRPVSDFVGAAVLGGAVVGMLLGHWYLTTPTMSIAPLQRINLFLGIAGLSRLALSMAAMLCLWTERMSAAKIGSELPVFMSVPAAWLGLRWLAGVFGPILISVMVWQILKLRNTQAATGVLFVGVILAFIGDMTAALLLRETTLPF